MVLAGLVELVGIHFVSFRWSLNIPVEMLIKESHGLRYCSNKSTHTHTSCSLEMICWIRRYGAVSWGQWMRLIYQYVSSRGSKLDTLLSIWRIAQSSACLLNMYAFMYQLHRTDGVCDGEYLISKHHLCIDGAVICTFQGSQGFAKCSEF